MVCFAYSNLINTPIFCLFHVSYPRNIVARSTQRITEGEEMIALYLWERRITSLLRGISDDVFSVVASSENVRKQSVRAVKWSPQGEFELSERATKS